MLLSLNKAAKQGGIAKTTLQRALKSGDISGTKNEKGQWEIDSAELGRWIGNRSPEQDETGPKNQPGTPEKPVDISVLERELEGLRERLIDKDETIEDLRKRLDTEGEERRKLTAILTDQREKASEPEPVTTAPPPEPKRLSWRERFTGKRQTAS